MLSVQCWTHMDVFHNLYSGLTVNAPLRILLTVYGGWGWDGRRRRDEVSLSGFPKECLSSVLERVLKL